MDSTSTFPREHELPLLETFRADLQKYYLEIYSQVEAADNELRPVEQVWIPCEFKQECEGALFGDKVSADNLLQTVSKCLAPTLIFLSGRAGAGKSLLAKKIASDWARNQGAASYFSILLTIPLPYIDGSLSHGVLHTALSYMLEVSGTRICADKLSELHLQIETLGRNGLICLDGFDPGCINPTLFVSLSDFARRGKFANHVMMFSRHQCFTSSITKVSRILNFQMYPPVALPSQSSDTHAVDTSQPAASNLEFAASVNGPTDCVKVNTLAVPEMFDVKVYLCALRTFVLLDDTPSSRLEGILNQYATRQLLFKNPPPAALFDCGIPAKWIGFLTQLTTILWSCSTGIDAFICTIDAAKGLNSHQVQTIDKVVQFYGSRLLAYCIFVVAGTCFTLSDIRSQVNQQCRSLAVPPFAPDQFVSLDSSSDLIERLVAATRRLARKSGLKKYQHIMQLLTNKFVQNSQICSHRGPPSVSEASEKRPRQTRHGSASMLRKPSNAYIADVVLSSHSLCTDKNDDSFVPALASYGYTTIKTLQSHVSNTKRQTIN